MTTLIPNSQASGAEAYEDMFKEITRKLYGEEATHGLHTPATHNTTGTTTSSDIDRSFSSLVSGFARILPMSSTTICDFVWF